MVQRAYWGLVYIFFFGVYINHLETDKQFIKSLGFLSISYTLKWWKMMSIQFLTPEKWFFFVLFRFGFWLEIFKFHNFKSWGREDNLSLLLCIWYFCLRFLGRIINESRKCFIFAFYYFVFITDFFVLSLISINLQHIKKIQSNTWMNTCAL